MNVVAIEKFKSFEWLTRGITASSPNFEPQVHGTGAKPLNYEDRLGAIASMESQLAKSVTALIIFDGKSQSNDERGECGMNPNDFLIYMLLLIAFCLVAGASSYGVNHALGFL